MLYAILCYHDEDLVGSWSKAEDDAVLAKRALVIDRLAAGGKLGPVARLMPTTAAVTVRSGNEPLVLDGPFAETKEQLLGFMSSTAPICRRRSRRPARWAAAKSGSFEIRPLRMFRPGTTNSRRWKPRERSRLARCRVAFSAAPGDRRAAALFPQYRPGRRSVPGGLLARPQALAGQRAAARSRRLADPSGAQTALDELRRRKREAPLPPDEAISDLEDAESDLAERLDNSGYRDDMLRLLFICCHPELPATQQIALALRVVSGLSVREIARAFLVSEAAMEQRITQGQAAHRSGGCAL